MLAKQKTTDEKILLAACYCINSYDGYRLLRHPKNNSFQNVVRA